MRRRTSKGLVKVGVMILLVITFPLMFNGNVHAYWEHTKNVQVAAGSYLSEPFTISSLPQGSILTNVAVQFTYIAYNGSQSYLSASVGKGADPGTSGGATIVSQGSLPASPGGTTQATYGYVSASNWNNKKANDTYYIRFNVAAGSPYAPTIGYVRIDLTYTTISPSVGVSPSSGANGTTFTETGSSFTPSNTATLYFYRPTLGWTSSGIATNVSGSFTNPWTCSSCPAGQYQYYAIDNETGIQSGTVYFSVASVNPSVGVTPSTGTNGTTFSETGSGFVPNGGVTMYFNRPSLGQTTTSISADSNGSYTNYWQCVLCPAGTYQYWAVDNTTSQQSNTVTFKIATPQVAVSPTTGTNGSTFSETGSGFTPSSTATLHFTRPGLGETTSSVNVLSDGTFTNNWTCTLCPVGTYQYWAVDNTTSQQSNTVTFTVTTVVNPQISITPTFGDQGTTFNEPGTGFTPNSTAVLHFKLPNGTELPTVTKNTDANGTYTHSWASNASSTVGTYQYWAVDSTTGKVSNTATFTLSAPSAYPVWVPVYRLYKSADKDHFYTTNVWERDNAVATMGYKYEKIEFYISDRPFTGGGPLYRYYYGGTNKHYYTTNTSNAAAGYTEGPGVIGYVYTVPTDGMAPLYHLEGPTGDHFYTISNYEYNNAKTNLSFTDWGVQCYISPTPVANNRPQGDFAGVGMFSGGFSVPFSDISLSGVGPALSLTRYYNSYNQYELPFGGGWSHSLYSYAIDHPNGDVTIKWGNGTEDFFKNDGAGNFNGINGTFSKLAKVTTNPDRYDLTAKDQTVFSFTRVSVKSMLAGDQLSFIPDLPMTSITDKFNNKVTLEADAATGSIYRATRAVNGVATTQVLRFYYDASWRLTSIVDTSITPNRAITYEYNTNGLLSSVTDTRNNTTQYTYNTDGLLNTITYPEGNTVTVNYDSLQRVINYTAGTAPNTITLTFDYNATTGTTVKNGTSPIVNYVHDSQYRAGQITPGDGTSGAVVPTYLTGNKLNLQDSVRDRNGQSSSFTYDANGNLLTSTNPLGETTTYTYDLNNNLKSVKDPRNNTTTYTYDATGKFLQSISKPMGGATQYSYFTNGLPQTVTDPTGHIITYSYDANGNATKINDNALNVSMDFTNDNAGRRLTQTDQLRPTPQLTTWGYDNNDNVTSVQVGSNPAATFTYDRNNRLTRVTDQRGKATTYTYNSANLMATQQSPDLKTWTYSYDSIGNLSTVSLPGSTTVSYVYYANNRLNKIRYNGADKTTYTYDNNGNVTSVADADGGGTTSFIYNNANRVTRIVTPFGSMFDYGYDTAGNRSSITYPGSKTVNYTFDNDNRLSTVKDWLNGTTTYAYNTAGILQSVTNANGTTATFGYDTANRLTSLANRKAGNSVIADYGLTLDKMGNPTSITRNEPLAPPIPVASDTTYTYDNANQIQSAGIITYSHDALGNLSGSTNGRSYTFDYANRLRNATIGADSYSFIYDAFGNRISRTKNGTQTRYLLDLNAGISNVLAETDSAGTVQNYYVHGLGLLSRINSAGQRATYHFDQLGNTVAVTDDSGTVTESYTYDEFGSVLASSGAGANPFRYVGKFGVMDEGNGLLHMRARYYDTETGRFLSRDPLGFDGGDLNLYAYVGGSPTTKIDPKGLKSRKGGLEAAFKKNKEIKSRNAKIKAIKKQQAIAEEYLINIDSITYNAEVKVLEYTKDGLSFVSSLIPLSSNVNEVFTFGTELYLCKDINEVENTVSGKALEMVVGFGIDKVMPTKGIINELRPIIDYGTGKGLDQVKGWIGLD